MLFKFEYLISARIYYRILQLVHITNDRCLLFIGAMAVIHYSRKMRRRQKRHTLTLLLGLFSKRFSFFFVFSLFFCFFARMPDFFYMYFATAKRISRELLNIYAATIFFYLQPSRCASIFLCVSWCCFHAIEFVFVVHVSY